MGDIISQMNSAEFCCDLLSERREDKLWQMGALALSGVPQRTFYLVSLFFLPDKRLYKFTAKDYLTVLM